MSALNTYLRGIFEKDKTGALIKITERMIEVAPYCDVNVNAAVRLRLVTQADVDTVKGAVR
jgi:hypothetical protein